jgi:hypothetical protein
MALDDEDKRRSLGLPPQSAAPRQPEQPEQQPQPRGPSRYDQVREPVGVVYDEHGAQIGMRVADRRNAKRVLPRNNRVADFDPCDI